MDEALKTFEELKKLCEVRTVNLAKMRKLCEGLVVPTVTLETEALVMRKEEYTNSITWGENVADYVCSDQDGSNEV